MKKILFLMILMMILSLTNVKAANIRVGISGEDTIVNDINNPYNQAEIDSIANIRVIDYMDNDITEKMIMVENGWILNEKVKGLFKQKYMVIFEEENYYYELNILNVDLEDNEEGNLENKVVDITVNSDIKKSTEEFINIIEERLLIEVNNYLVLEDSYTGNYQKEGNYKIKLSIKTTENQNIIVTCNVKVVTDDQNGDIGSKVKLIVIIILLLLAVVMLVRFILKRRG